MNNIYFYQVESFVKSFLMTATVTPARENVGSFFSAGVKPGNRG